MARTTVEIARAPEDVFAFVIDPAKLSLWQDAEEVHQLTDGPVMRIANRALEQITALGFRRFHRRLKRALEPGAA